MNHTEHARWPPTGARRPPRNGRAIVIVALFSVLAVGAILATSVLAGTVSSPAAPSAASPSTAPPVTGNATPLVPSFPTPIRHVFTVVLENANLATVLRDGPFEKHLIATYGTATHYYSVCHPSAPNYLALTSADPYQCGSDSYHVYAATNVADLVEKAGLTWAAYMESMPTPCATANSGNYVVRHDPFVYYQDIVQNSTRCQHHVLSFTAWNSSVASGNLPNYAFLSPNVLDDGHNTGVAYADAWLKKWLSPLLNDSFFQSSVFLIVYDESKTSTAGYAGLTGGAVYVTAVSPLVAVRAAYTQNSSHYNLLTTTEWLLGLGNTGHNDAGSAFPPMKSLFRTSTPVQYALQGTVTRNATGAAISGATVAVPSGPMTTTGASGGYSLSLANGTYSVNASAPGFEPRAVQATISGSAVTLNFTLSAVPPATYPVSGVVDNASGGGPLAGVTISAGNGSVTTSDANGAYSLELPNGSYQLEAVRAGYVSQSAPVTVQGHGVLQNFSLRPTAAPLYTLAGAADYANGSAVEGATVSVNPGSLSATTNRSGGFSFRVPDGAYVVTVSQSGYASVRANVTVQGANRTVVLTFGPYESLIQGVVRSGSTGAPIAGANISAGPGFVATTDSSGEYDLSLPNGSYVLSVTAPGFAAQADPLSVNGAPRIQNVTLNASTSPAPAASSLPIVEIAVGLGAVATAGAVVLLARRRHRPKAPT